MNNEDDPLALLQQENAALRERVAQLEKTAATFEEMRSLMDNGLFIIDGEGRYVEVFATRLISAKAAQAMRNGHIRNVLSHDLVNEMIEVIKRSLLTGATESVDYQLPFLGPDIWHRAAIKPLPSGDVLWFSRDVTAERRLTSAEREHIALQEQVIEAQRAALRELSTPLVPLADGVIAMPLIGTIDATRAQEVMEKLLEGIVKQRAHTAILDITGVRVVDSHAADALLRVARAARLLGAQLILTGIAPAIAQSLAQSQVDMAGVVTLSNLQSGIAHALRTAAGG